MLQLGNIPSYYAVNSACVEHKYALVEWVAEDSSVVPCIQVGGVTYNVGEIARVKTSQGVFEALVAAVGKSSDYY